MKCIKLSRLWSTLNEDLHDRFLVPSRIVFLDYIRTKFLFSDTKYNRSVTRTYIKHNTLVTLIQSLVKMLENFNSPYLYLHLVLTVSFLRRTLKSKDNSLFIWDYFSRQLEWCYYLQLLVPVVPWVLQIAILSAIWNSLVFIFCVLKWRH